MATRRVGRTCTPRARRNTSEVTRKLGRETHYFSLFSAVYRDSRKHSQVLECRCAAEHAV